MGLLADATWAVLTGLWLMLPAYLANMMPVFVGGGTPIDFGKTWKDGRRVLGNGKTWRGLLLGPLLGAILTYALQWTVDNTAWGSGYGFPGWGPSPWWFFLAYMMGLGALVGDAVESFFKRRTGRDRGEPWVPFDQLDFVVGAVLFALLACTLLAVLGLVTPNSFFTIFTWPRLLAILILTPGFHLLVNVIGYKMGLKKEPW
ncbi:MAG TPA: CDP-2,3-bis-(O-geranylgeranyl)-sn-glycerol synthase [Candidatus Thermoplasmatota archaeon]|nr:CDP-2,3-bis-(O-geranylgeranyl)-sn-glycerol synthase [Candidatus Thermoplasmatota archaeon]